MLTRSTHQEQLSPFPGDELISNPGVISDNAVTIDAPIDQVYGFLAQMGRRDDDRGGWPLPHSVERLIPEKRRGLRSVVPDMALRKGDILKDWVNPTGDVMGEVVEADAPHTLVFTSDRGKRKLSWALLLSSREDGQTELHTRLRMTAGKERTDKALRSLRIFDRLAMAGLKRGIEQRVAEGSHITSSE